MLVESDQSPGKTTDESPTIARDDSGPAEVSETDLMEVDQGLWDLSWYHRDDEGTPLWTSDDWVAAV